MKAGWMSVRLAEVATKIGSGATPSGGESSYKQSGVALIRSMNVHDDGFRFQGLAFIDNKQASKLGHVSVEADDVLLNITGASVARSCIVPSELLSARVNQHVAIIRVKKEHVKPKFLHYLLISPQYKKRLLNIGEENGATRQALTKSQIQDLDIHLPSIPEQHRIVAILDEAFAAIAIAKANAEKNLQNARDLFESYLNEVFTRRGEGWEDKNLNQLADHSLGKMLDTNKNKGDFRPYLRNTNVRWLEFDLRDLKQMRFLASEKDRYSAICGDVLVCEGGYPGRAAIWEGEEGVYFQKALHRVRFKASGHNAWFVYFLMHEHLSGKLSRRLTGTGIQHLTGFALDQMLIPLPRPEQMENVLSRIDLLFSQVQTLQDVNKNRAQLLESLVSATLEKAFSGML